MPNALDSYIAAVQKFQESATSGMESCAKAREAYEEAVRTSDEIRGILSSQTDTLGTVMAKLQESMSLQLIRKAEPPNAVQTQANEKSNENIPALLQQLEGSSKSNNGDEGKVDSSAALKKKIWQL